MQLSQCSASHPQCLPDLHRAALGHLHRDFQRVFCRRDKQCVKMAQPCQAELALGAASLTHLEVLAYPQGHRQLRLVVKDTLPTVYLSSPIRLQLPEHCPGSYPSCCSRMLYQLAPLLSLSHSWRLFFFSPKCFLPRGHLGFVSGIKVFRAGSLISHFILMHLSIHSMASSSKYLGAT